VYPDHARLIDLHSAVRKFAGVKWDETKNAELIGTSTNKKLVTQAPEKLFGTGCASACRVCVRR